ncbi:MAG: hypothetical protein R2737_06280 [Candidatus Nanopelagicales bacterium]
MSVSAAVAVAVYHPGEGGGAELANWQRRIDQAAARFPGFIGVQGAALSSDPDAWGVAIGFDGPDNLRRWLDSPTRQALLAEALDRELVSRAYSDVVVVEGEQPPGGVAVFLHQVRPGAEETFIGAQEALQLAAGQCDGFESSVVFPPGPTAGRWMTVLRFSDDDGLSRWLDSPVRATALDVLESALAEDFESYATGRTFGAIVRVEDGVPEVTPQWKVAMTVLLVLYPTVMLLTRFVGPAFAETGMPFWLNMFLQNILSVAALTWLLMPSASRLLRRWLDPVDGRSPRVSWRGVLVVASCYAVSLLVFAVVPFLEIT